VAKRRRNSRISAAALFMKHVLSAHALRVLNF